VNVPNGNQSKKRKRSWIGENSARLAARSPNYEEFGFLQTPERREFTQAQCKRARFAGTLQ
jgi:hypothetical protein